MMLSQASAFSAPLKKAFLYSTTRSCLLSGFPEECFLFVEYSELSHNQMATIYLVMAQYLVYIKEPGQITRK